MSTPLRILELIRKSEGGMREHYITLTIGLKRKGHSVVALCDFDNHTMERLRHNGLTVMPFTLPGEIQLLRDVMRVFRVSQIIRETKPDVIHCHGFKAGLVGRIAGWLAGCPCVYTVHNFVNHENSRMKNVLLYGLERLLASVSKMIIAVSEALKEDMVRHMHVPGHKIHVIHNGVPRLPSGDGREIRQLYGIDDKAMIVGTVSRLIRTKGIHFLLRAVPEIKRVYPEIKFMIVGGGPEMEHLQSIAYELGVEDAVIFTGHVQNIHHYYTAFNIFVLPTLSEGLGISIIEAMMSQLPVVASNTGGIPEIVSHQCNGWLVAPGNSKEIRDTLLMALENPEKAKELGQFAAQDVKQRFGLNKMINDTEAVFLNLTGK